MSYISFARNREDVMIVRALGHIAQGYYVDVGACRPVADSNTYALYLRGWSGLVVEPQQRFHRRWSKVRERDALVSCAIGATGGSATLFAIEAEQGATTSESIAAMHASAGRAVTQTMVPQRSLTDLLAAHRPAGDIHLLSVDVEGSEGAVLAGLDLQRFRPWLMVLESVVPGRFEDNSAQWEPQLLQSGYRFAYWDAVNKFYVADEHADLLRHFAYPPCVWDDFEDYQLSKARLDAIAATRALEACQARLRK